ncbi:ISXO2-like transposase domain-containing protein [Palleronia pelagia]|uniref:ISXO2-like transposase domain-containing protein n=2 Tax=Palleronia pelagia TaxID=387096 RepID=A0A1H8MCC6_9RHOB|nr:ISXO2-like transposase domain-containing protein [Palleronia pelagia]
MTDGSKSYRGLGQTMADHQYVIHSQKEYANPETGAHVNTAEAVISEVQRALVGVYHNLDRQHPVVSRRWWKFEGGVISG